ncbi:hypothetical protein M378DRAFT_820513 [Amanita muscaria Koide BX008]|uniref:Uncharacterized protein n=1 Tax=Amanita muscaria (strain Koide BX008) TaxID=946122 RepID=A0A0C2T595_AMAMK|nr:hypothetical protein M378DRAFT_820513 [Amanita muscaria Koide BX008]
MYQRLGRGNGLSHLSDLSHKSMTPCIQLFSQRRRTVCLENPMIRIIPFLAHCPIEYQNVADHKLCLTQLRMACLALVRSTAVTDSIHAILPRSLGIAIIPCSRRCTTLKGRSTKGNTNHRL